LAGIFTPSEPTVDASRGTVTSGHTGIGGLAAAVALRRVGIRSLVVERADSIREVGAGLTIWPNAVNALRELGVETRVTDSASVIELHSVRTPAGRLLTVTDFADISHNAGAPCICLHRAVLQRILLEELPPACVRTGTRCVGFDDSTAILEDGERIEADVLVGADGISSVIRAGLHGAEPPRYAGYTCWRGILRKEGALPDRAALLAVGAGSQFGLWPCGAGQLYWFLTKNAPQGTAQTNRSRFMADGSNPATRSTSFGVGPRLVHGKLARQASGDADVPKPSDIRSA
jgi:2-polyprenyl-6-methoxyphenol hydroxylase-like FAD-dependent oxidoreductase